MQIAALHLFQNYHITSMKLEMFWDIRVLSCAQTFLALFRHCKIPSGWTTCWQHKKMPWIWIIHFKVSFGVLHFCSFSVLATLIWPLVFWSTVYSDRLSIFFLQTSNPVCRRGYSVHVAVYTSRRSYRQSALRRHLVALSLKHSLSSCSTRWHTLFLPNVMFCIMQDKYL